MALMFDKIPSVECIPLETPPKRPTVEDVIIKQQSSIQNRKSRCRQIKPTYFKKNNVN